MKMFLGSPCSFCEKGTGQLSSVMWWERQNQKTARAVLAVPYGVPLVVVIGRWYCEHTSIRHSE